MACKDLEKRKDYMAAWCKLNAEKISALKKAWAEANPDRMKAHQAAWRKANPEKVKLRNTRHMNPGVPEELLKVIVLKNMIREEIRNQTKPK